MQIVDFIWHWLLHQSAIELVAFVTGLLCVYLAARNNIWNWPFAIISTALYIFIFAKAALYADMGQSAYLLFVNIYGWYYWSHQPANAQKVPVIHITKKQVLYGSLIIAVASPLLGSVLTMLAPILHYTPAAYPYLDSFCTVVSLTAQMFMARKILENWLMWVFVDAIYVGIYLAKDMHLTAVLYGVYFFMAAYGYYDWRRELKKQGTVN